MHCARFSLFHVLFRTVFSLFSSLPYLRITMGIWIVSNCSPTLRIQDLPREVQQGSELIIRCYLPLKHEPSASTATTTSSARETWWICDCTTEHPELSAASCGTIQKAVGKPIAYTWLPQVRVPPGMPTDLPWPAALAYLPFTVFEVVKHMYEWHNKESR